MGTEARAGDDMLAGERDSVQIREKTQKASRVACEEDEVFISANIRNTAAVTAV